LAGYKEFWDRYRAENRQKVRENQRRYDEKHHDKLRAKAREKYAENAEKHRQWHREYYAANREVMQERSRRQYANNSEKVRKRTTELRYLNHERKREWERQHYRANRERIWGYQRKWAEKNAVSIAECRRRYEEKNREKIAERKRLRHLANPDIARAKTARRRARLMDSEVFEVTQRDIRRLIERHRNCCFYCGKKGRLELDHVVPISREGNRRHSIGNLVPACKSCNSSKCDLTIMEWRTSPTRKGRLTLDRTLRDSS
jgi:5-methylcytosine-specific restriction endonuclease McrA